MGRAALTVGLALLLAAPAAGRAAELRDIRSIVAPGSTRLVLDVGQRVEYRLHAVPANRAAGIPARLYVDLRGTRLGRTVPTRLSPPGGPLVRLRGSERRNGATRLILDVPGLHDYRAFPLLDPFRLVVDVHGTPRPVPAPLAAVAAPAPPAVPPRRPFTIVLDPGHGGTDPGARGVGGVAEKDVVLAVARALRARLAAAGYRVRLTRERDVFVSLEERTARANAARADLFVSLHANASPNRAASGIETYYLSNTDDRATIRLAHMENHLAYMTGRPVPASDVKWILSDMIQSYKVDQSFGLAEAVQAALVAQVRRRHRDVRDLGVKPGPFFVLVGAGMPAVLVELSFLTHGEEGRRLARNAYQELLADGLLRGIERFAEASRVAAAL